MIDIEGVANLYKINSYLDKAKISKELNYEKLEEYHILNDNLEINIIDYNTFYNSVLNTINNFIDSEKSDNNDNISEYSEEETPSPLPPVKTEIPPGTNLLASSFDFKPKKIKKEPIIIKTDYEKDKINKLIYGGNKVIENDSERLGMIESIESLRDELEHMDIKVNNIPEIDENSSMYDIKNVYKMLLHKKNTSVNYETARDLILIGVNGLVNMCDGSQTSWGKKPDLRGFQKTAKLKLNGLKTELSTLASNFFTNYNIGPLTQILLSLIPSAILHASLNNSQNNIEANNDNALQNLRDLL